MPVLAVLAVIALACAVVIVVMLPALAVEDVVPITKFELPVPAPIRSLITAPLIFVFNDGSEPLDKIAGLPVSVTLAVLAVIADA